LGSGRSDNNDSNDARSVAIAALRADRLVSVRVEDHATVLRLLSRRHTQLAWARNKTACRLHALVADLVPGGISKEVVASQALALLEGVAPAWMRDGPPYLSPEMVVVPAQQIVGGGVTAPILAR